MEARIQSLWSSAWDSVPRAGGATPRTDPPTPRHLSAALDGGLRETSWSPRLRAAVQPPRRQSRVLCREVPPIGRWAGVSH